MRSAADPVSSDALSTTGRISSEMAMATTASLMRTNRSDPRSLDVAGTRP